MRWGKPGFLLLAAAAALFSAAPLRAQGGPIGGTASLGVSATPPTAGIGAAVSVSVRVDLSSVTGGSPTGSRTAAVLGGYQIGIAFDKTRLRFDSVAGGSSAGFTSAPTSTTPAIANASGALTIVASQTSSTSPTGLVSVAVLSFTTLSGGVASISATATNLVSAFNPGPPPVGPTSIAGIGSSISVTVLAPTPTAPPPTATPSAPPSPTQTAPPPNSTPTPTPPNPTRTPTNPPPTATPTAPPGTPTATATPGPPTPPPTQGPASPTPPPPVPYAKQSTVTIPVASHVIGSGGLLFVSDVEIENPSAGFASASFSFTPAGERAITVTLVLAPFETRVLPDAVGMVFGVFDAVGALRLDSAQPLRMSSRNYQRSSSGSFGQAISGFSRTAPTAPARSVAGLARTNALRTNLGAVNDSDSPKSFRISLWGMDGRSFGSTPVLQLLPGGQMQRSLAGLFPEAFGKGMTANFETADASSAPFGYAIVADNSSGDPTYYPSSLPQQSATLPVAARVRGVNGNRFLADVSLTNVTDEPVWLKVRFLEHEHDNVGFERIVSIALAGRQTRQMDDAIGSLFGLDDTYGALEVESSAPASLLVAERIYTDSSTTPGTVGQQVDPVAPDGFLTSGSVLGIRHNAEFRSNLGLFNPQTSAVQITLTLRRDSGSFVASSQLSLPPRSHWQRSVAELFPEAALSSPASWTVAVDSSAPIFAYGVVVDNVSEDPTYAPALK